MSNTQYFMVDNFYWLSLEKSRSNVLYNNYICHKSKHQKLLMTDWGLLEINLKSFICIV